VSQAAQPILSAPSATATLESRVGEVTTGRVSLPSGKLKGAAFQNLLADWSLEKGVLTLSPADSATARESADLSEARGQALVDALTKLLEQYLGAAATR